MSKAYDRMKWRFRIKVMRVMGFSNGFQGLVYRSNIRYRVCLNGFYSTEFRFYGGVRQGEPLSFTFYHCTANSIVQP